MILVLDNRDSFTFNLVQALQGLGATVLVRKAEKECLDSILELKPAGLLLGPGPGRPENAKLSLELIAAEHAPPILGVCLGQQAIAHHFGACVQRSSVLRHGRTSEVLHDGRGVFAGLPNPTAFTRYNSLTVSAAGLPACLEISARCEHGEVMGIRHRTRSLEGVQFHPESVLSEAGVQLLANFVAGSAEAPSAGVHTGQGPAGRRRSSPS